MKFTIERASELPIDMPADKVEEILDCNGPWTRLEIAEKIDGERKRDIELNSIEDLAELIEKYGALIIEDNEITIYDTYVE